MLSLRLSPRVFSSVRGGGRYSLGESAFSFSIASFPCEGGEGFYLYPLFFFWIYFGFFFSGEMDQQRRSCTLLFPLSVPLRTFLFSLTDQVREVSIIPFFPNFFPLLLLMGGNGAPYLSLLPPHPSEPLSFFPLDRPGKKERSLCAGGAFFSKDFRLLGRRKKKDRIPSPSPFPSLLFLV